MNKIKNHYKTLLIIATLSETTDIFVIFSILNYLLKHLTTFLIIFFSWTNCFAQNFRLEIKANTIIENKVIDSMQYKTAHSDAKSVRDEAELMSERLSQIGYLENKINENTKINDSLFLTKMSLGERIKFIHIYIGRNQSSFTAKKKTEIPDYTLIKNLIAPDNKKDTITLAYDKLESFLKNTLQKLEQNGFAFAKLKLINIKKRDNSLLADLQFETGQQRQLNEIVVQFNANNKKVSLPEGHLKQINRKYKNSTFNQDVVLKIQKDFEKFSFVSQIKTPEILFTKDTTKVFVYLEKRKSNSFDGFIGFANNDNNKLTFNGYLDVVLENTIKAGEQFSLYWKSDGNDQKTFKAGIDLPYIFKTPIGLKAQIHIFKQDSIFQNTKTAIDLGYFIDYNTRIYFGYQATESGDIQNTNSSSISDYSNSFLSTNLEYSQIDYKNSLFTKKTNIAIHFGLGNRTTADEAETAGQSQQTFVTINAMHNFYINATNCFNINYQNYFLKSDNYIINELYRFGGTRSIRGYAENSFQANLMTAIITEYRYILSSEFYIHSIFDYAYYEDQSTKTKGNLIGIGAGIGLKTTKGLLKLNLSNGLNQGKHIKFENTIISFNYNIEF